MELGSAGAGAQSAQQTLTLRGSAMDCAHPSEPSAVIEGTN